MKSFKTKLKVNNQQKTILAKHAGVARHAYNWGLATCITEYQETKKRPSAITLHKRLVPEVKPINPWYYEVSKCAARASIKRFRKGMLFGIIFFVPIFGMAIGAAMGALSGSFKDIGINDDFIKDVRTKVTEGTSALFFLSTDAVVDRVAEVIKEIDFEIVATNLPKEQEEKLREMFVH